MINYLHIQTKDEVMEEIKNQYSKWGMQNLSLLEWMSILVEEVGEAAKAANDLFWSCTDEQEQLKRYKAELTQVAAVAISAIENLKRQRESL